MSEYIYRTAAWARGPAACSTVKSEVSVQITSRTKARRAEAHEEFNESEVLQRGDKPAACQRHFFTHFKDLNFASCYQALPRDTFPLLLLLHSTKKCYISNIPTYSSQGIYTSLLELKGVSTSSDCIDLHVKPVSFHLSHSIDTLHCVSIIKSCRCHLLPFVDPLSTEYDPSLGEGPTLTSSPASRLMNELPDWGTLRGSNGK